eukprot:TRINITY_DN19_c0_g1_i1.p1 TRINITY_DN19_c0_g1~~TRINITY_DN19_c0_g1_i1.p1  ORF type:complete len:145 (-),score=34.20 TRINITY_DN19_c0_g1_i1:109-543(-)
MASATATTTKSKNAKKFTVRTKRFMNNKLLQRKQMSIEVLHLGGTIPKAEIRKKLAKTFKTADPNQIILYGFHTAFGGGKSRGFALVYDNMEAVNQFEPKYRLIRSNLAKKGTLVRKQRKDRKNRAKKLRGKKKATVAQAAAKK